MLAVQPVQEDDFPASQAEQPAEQARHSFDVEPTAYVV